MDGRRYYGSDLPMMYFQGNNFYPFALDWQEQSNGRQVIPGLGIYFLHPDEGKWTRDEIDRQINFIRNHKMAGDGTLPGEISYGEYTGYL